jgi:hypothetical protein
MHSSKDLIGNWSIVEMELWDREALDLVAPAILTINKDGQGRMAFIAVDVHIDYRIVVRDGLPAIEFSFQGIDEGDEVTGRAWGVLEGERLRGRLFFHMGDDSSFVAERDRRRTSRKRQNQTLPLRMSRKTPTQ